MNLSVLTAILVASASPAIAEGTYRGLGRFELGVTPTSLALVQHADGSMVLQASDGDHAVTCYGENREWWTGARALFAGVLEGWYRVPSQHFQVTVPFGEDSDRTCELSAFTLDYHTYVEIVAIDQGVRAEYARVELSPIATSHSIVEVLAVQRVEDNTDGVRLAQAAVVMIDILAGDTSQTIPKLEWLESQIEDTATYSTKIIEAHSDLALFVLVLDTFLHSGNLPSNSDIGAAYRVKDMLRDDRPRLFIRVLGSLAGGETASSLLRRVRACGDGADPIVCLD